GRPDTGQADSNGHGALVLLSGAGLGQDRVVLTMAVTVAPGSVPGDVQDHATPVVGRPGLRGLDEIVEGVKVRLDVRFVGGPVLRGHERLGRRRGAPRESPT